MVAGLVGVENRLVISSGDWAEGVYIPAHVRRYPLFPLVVNGETETTERGFLVGGDEAALSRIYAHPLVPPITFRRR